MHVPVRSETTQKACMGRKAVALTSAGVRNFPSMAATDTSVGLLTSVFLGAVFLASANRSSSNLK